MTVVFALFFNIPPQKKQTSAINMIENGVVSCQIHNMSSSWNSSGCSWALAAWESLFLFCCCLWKERIFCTEAHGFDRVPYKPLSLVTWMPGYHLPRPQPQVKKHMTTTLGFSCPLSEPGRQKRQHMRIFSDQIAEREKKKIHFLSE